MNKLILLDNIKKDKIKNNNFIEFNKIKSEQENYNKSYTVFRKKFNCFQDEEEFIDLNNIDGKESKNGNEKKLNKIMKRIFSLKNNIPMIEFINSIYNDELSIGTKIKYIRNKEIIAANETIILKKSRYNLRILAEDDYKEVEYRLQFQVKDDENLAIIITRINLTAEDNIIKFNKRKKECNIYSNLRDNCDRCLIMLNSNIEVPDVYEIESDCKDQNVGNKINIIKGWKYDFKLLLEKNMYLLFPMKVLDLKKRLITISDELASTDLIKNEVSRFFNDMNRYLNKVEKMNLITHEDIGELNLISIELLDNLITEKNNINMKRDIDEAFKDIVV